MGHKVHPNGFRLGVYRNWEAKWFAPDKEYKALLLEDVRLRRMLLARLKNAGVARIETERSSSALTVTLHTAKPGIVIGKGGTSVDQLRDELEKRTGKRVRVTIQEIKKPELSAQLVAENVAAQLEKRIAFRRAIKQSLMKTMRAGAQGVKIRVKGRLGGSEMGRIEWNREGRVPLHTLKADIDFGQTEARTTFGRIGVSAWVYTGNFPTDTPQRVAPAAAEEPVDGGVPLAASLPQIPAPVAELMPLETVATMVPAVPGAAPEPALATAPAATAEAPARPKRAPRALKAAAAEGSATEGGANKPAPKRASRSKAAPASAEAGETPKTPKPRATKKKE
ncbi:MAG: 30S ribosomal protein S3 [Candidatus Dormibacteraeota bacterium]|nr:30S ribosomal protein S3 [Candidatus Dormibacteraeota bacterium]